MRSEVSIPSVILNRVISHQSKDLEAALCRFQVFYRCAKMESKNQTLAKYFALICSTGISCPVHRRKEAAPW